MVFLEYNYMSHSQKGLQSIGALHEKVISRSQKFFMGNQYIKVQKDDVIQVTSATRTKSQNPNVSPEEAKNLHLAAANLDDKLHGTSYQLAEREKIHALLLTLLEDFEKVCTVLGLMYPTKRVFVEREIEYITFCLRCPGSTVFWDQPFEQVQAPISRF